MFDRRKCINHNTAACIMPFLFLCFFRKETSLTHRPRVRSPNLVLICHLCEMIVGQNHEFFFWSWRGPTWLLGLALRRWESKPCAGKIYTTELGWSSASSICVLNELPFSLLTNNVSLCWYTLYRVWTSLCPQQSSYHRNSIMCRQCTQPLGTCTVRDVPIVSVWYTIRRV